MTLQKDLDAQRGSWEARVGDQIARMIAGDIENLRGSGILDRAARAGGNWPPIDSLIDQHANGFDLSELIARKPVIVTFYRGGWCPYCNLELRAYQSALSEIQALGAELVAVSFERPDHSLDTAEKNGLRFTVLSDIGGQLAAALGIRFQLSDTVRPYYERAGHDLPARNGNGDWALPMPATFVVAQGGRIAAAFIEPDYRIRLDPQEALAALREISRAVAA